MYQYILATLIAIMIIVMIIVTPIIIKGYKRKKKVTLSPKEVIQFCDETIDKIITNTDIYQGYLCNYLRSFLINNKKISISKLDNENLNKFIPEFTNKNAVKHANGRKSSPHQTWWSGNLDKGGYDKENRILFLEWIRDQYVILKEKRTPKVK